MKKFLLLTSFFILFFVNVKLTFAQEACPEGGFGEAGCFSCSYNESASLCSFVGNPGEIFCGTGYYPNTAVCDEITDFNQCGGIFRPCITDTYQKYFCNSSRSCERCDDDPSATYPDCPSETFDGNGTCQENCSLSNIYSCENQGGTCKSTCEVGVETNIAADNCTGATSVCCIPARNIQVSYICNENSIDTAIGCIPLSGLSDTMGFFLQWSTGIVGGIAIILILFAGLQIITSSGNPEKLIGGKNLLFSALTGTILIILSIFILRFIGVNVLGIL